VADAVVNLLKYGVTMDRKYIEYSGEEIDKKLRE